MSILQSLNKFSFETLKKIGMVSNDENIVFSPYSAFINTSSSATLFKNKTMSEIISSLQIEWKEHNVNTMFRQLQKLIDKESTDKVSILNQIWANEIISFNPEIFTTNLQMFKINIQKSGFPQPACDKMNEEANNITKGMISKLINPSDISSDSSFVLLNAIYFKCDWEKKFIIDPESNDQKIKNFTLVDGTKVHTDMMESFGQIYPYAENEKFQVVSIPYLNNQYEFIIILPKNSTINGFNHIKKLTFERLNNDLLTKFVYQKVDLKLPKFTFESKIKLNDVFQDLGMKIAFTENAECADPENHYYISSIIQNAKIVIDEKGIETAIVAPPITRCSCCCCFMQAPCPQVFANHPFAYLIRNSKTGSIILEGFVKNPSL